MAKELAVDTMMVPFVVTGTITNNTDLPLPPGIRIYYKGGYTGEGTPWLHDFPTGYSVGRGIGIPDERHEGFEPVEPTGIEITVDDLENLVFVNWS